MRSESRPAERQCTPAQATMKVLVSPDRIAYRIPDRDAFEALVKRLELPGDPVAKNLRQLLGIQAVGLDGRTGSDCRHNWQLYGSVSWLEHNEYGLVPVVGDIDHRWGQVRQLDPSVERDAVKNLCNGKVKKTKGGWSYKGGGKIGPPLFPEAQIADGASLVELAARTQPLAAVPEPFAGAVLPAGYAEAIASLNQREPAGDPAGAASSTAFAPAAAFIAACDVASQTVQSFVTSWAAASSAPAPPLSRSISPPRLTGGTSLGARGRIDATIPRRPASAPPTFNRGSLTLLTLAAAGAPSVHHQRFAAADFDIVASVAALAANASTADDPNPAAPSDTTTAVGGANATSNSSASPAASAVTAPIQPAAAAAADAPLLGQRVVLGGLSARPELNGQRGVAQSFEGGRYAVELEGGGESVRVRPGNLSPAAAAVARRPASPASLVSQMTFAHSFGCGCAGGACPTEMTCEVVPDEPMPADQVAALVGEIQSENRTALEVSAVVENLITRLEEGACRDAENTSLTAELSDCEQVVCELQASLAAAKSLADKLKQQLGGTNWLSARGNFSRAQSEKQRLEAEKEELAAERDSVSARWKDLTEHVGPRLRASGAKLLQSLGFAESARDPGLHDDLAASVPKNATDIGLTDRQVDRLLGHLEQELFACGGGRVGRTRLLSAQLTVRPAVQRLFGESGRHADRVQKLTEASAKMLAHAKGVLKQLTPTHGTRSLEDHQSFQTIVAALVPDDATNDHLMRCIGELLGIQWSQVDSAQRRNLQNDGSVGAFSSANKISRKQRKDFRGLGRRVCVDYWHKATRLDTNVGNKVRNREVNASTGQPFYREHWRHVQYDTDEQIAEDFFKSRSTTSSTWRTAGALAFSKDIFLQSKCFCINKSDFQECACPTCTLMRETLRGWHAAACQVAPRARHGRRPHRAPCGSCAKGSAYRRGLGLPRQAARSSCTVPAVKLSFPELAIQGRSEAD